MHAPPDVVTSRSPLRPTPFLPLRLGTVEPQGWLRRQLRLQAIGITGHLDEIWPDVGPTSGWLGGDGEDWERGPYYVDGLVPLAYLLKDPGLIAKAQAWIHWTLQSQREDGFFGPTTNQEWWARVPMLKALTQYHEATGDERVLPFLTRYFRYQRAHLEARPFVKWAAARGGDALYCIYWLYNRTGDPFLLDLAHLVFAQTTDWTSVYLDFPYTTRQTEFHLETHVVNVAMGFRAATLYWLQSGDPRHAAAPRAGIAHLMQHHGFANGLFSGDEWLAGRDPSQGTETCAVVEYLFSLAILARTFGDVCYADLLEKVGFNALPAAFIPDLWGHQYDQQPNQVLVNIAKRNWTSNGDDANLFGLEPNFGCCTANQHQGWPKLAANLWAATPEGGLAALAYAPSRVRARLADGVPITIIEATDYPFADVIRFTMEPSRPIRFALSLRVPEWCVEATATVRGESAHVLTTGAYATLDRVWQPGDEVVLHLPMRVRISRWHRNSIAIERGPLVYSLAVGEAWQKVRGSEPCPDWAVHPTGPWNYGLLIDPDVLDAGFRIEQHPVPFQPFDAVAPPVRLLGKGKRLPTWCLQQHSAGPLPESPVASEEATEELMLVPYGCARLRVTQFPEIARA